MHRDSWKVALVSSAMTLAAFVLGSWLFSSHDVEAQGGAYRTCFFGRQETVDINDEGRVATPGAQIIMVPAGWEVASGGGAGPGERGIILFCRR